MRAMRIEVLHGNGKVPLVVRGRVEKTFLGLGLFAAVNLFLCGAYLLMEMIREPLAATEVTVLVAGFTLSLASFIITFLVFPRHKSALAKHEKTD